MTWLIIHQIVKIKKKYSSFLSFSHRLCYTVRVKKCIDNNNDAHHVCRLFDGKDGFKLDRLSTTGDNESSVYFQAIDGSEQRTVCFFNVSVADASSSNCSAMRLQHKPNHPQENYVDRLSESDTNSTSPCKSYVRVYYGSEDNRQYQTLCREELATLDDIFHVTSIFAVYWTNNDRSNNGSLFSHSSSMLMKLIIMYVISWIFYLENINMAIF